MLFIVSYATEENGFVHASSHEIPCSFIAGTQTPDFASLSPYAYFVTLMNKSRVVQTWRKSKDTLEFVEQYKFKA